MLYMLLESVFMKMTCVKTMQCLARILCEHCKDISHGNPIILSNNYYSVLFACFAAIFSSAMLSIIVDEVYLIYNPQKFQFYNDP